MSETEPTLIDYPRKRGRNRNVPPGVCVEPDCRKALVTQEDIESAVAHGGRCRACRAKQAHRQYKDRIVREETTPVARQFSKDDSGPRETLPVARSEWGPSWGFGNIGGDLYGCSTDAFTARKVAERRRVGQ